MKKFFTSILLLGAAMAASAANFTVTAFGNSEPIKDGDVISCGYTLNNGAIYAWHPELKLTTTGDVYAYVGATGATVDGITAQLCGIDGRCKMLENNVEVSKMKNLTAGADENLQIDIAMAFAPLSQVLPVKVLVSDMKTGDEITFTVNFLPEEQTAIRSISALASATSVSIQGRTLNFNAETPCDITLYSISGQAAISRHINGHGSLSLSSLPAGVYIYRAGTKTGKLILR